MPEDTEVTTASTQASPHGGALKTRLASAQEKDQWLGRVGSLPSIQISGRTLADLECIAVGAFSPLEGFMDKPDYESVVTDMRLQSGLLWSLPITLAVSAEKAGELKQATDILLEAPGGDPLAILHLENIFEYDAPTEAKHVYRTQDPAHPGVAALFDQGDRLLAGRVTVLSLPPGRQFEEQRMTPAQTRQLIQERGFKTVTGFQTRNPIHRAHEYLTKCALEIVDGLLLHPLVGETKGDDIPADVRMKAYRVLLDDFYPPERVVLAVFPAAMRYAGPREAIFHAICRKNYGCTHFIVGRDHAGVGSYYGSFDAHEIFQEFPLQDLGITPLFFDHAFWCRRCDQMASAKSCPHPAADRVSLSGTEVRRRLLSGEDIPKEFSRPEVAAVLRAAAAAAAESSGAG